MYNPHLEILPCPTCSKKAKIRTEDVYGNVVVYVACDEGCAFFVGDVQAPRTTEVAKELLRRRAIRKWNAEVKKHEERTERCESARE